MQLQVSQGALAIHFKHAAQLLPELGPNTPFNGDLGVDHEQLATSRPFLGARTASRTLTDALLRFGSIERYELFTPPHLLPLAEQRLKALPSAWNVTKRIALRTYDHLTSDEGVEFGLWAELMEDWMAILQLRSRRSWHPVPITGITHTITYHGLLHSWILPTLLARTEPYDSLICTSRAALRGVQNLIEHVAHAMRERCNADLSYNGRLDVIPLGVDTDALRPLPRHEARESLGIPVDAFVILYFGRFSLTDKADLSPLITVFTRLVRTHPDMAAVLLLAGGDQRSHSQLVMRQVTDLGIAPQVRFLRDVPECDKARVYNVADVFVSPVDNLQETFGLAPVEAMACGVPQVVADWSGYRDTVVHGSTGFLVPTLWSHCDDDVCDASDMMGWQMAHATLAQATAIDVNEFYLSLEALLDDCRRRDMAIRSRERAVTAFSLPVVVRRYEQLWAELTRDAAVAGASYRKQNDHARPAYTKVFGHFASRMIDGATLLRLTDAGASAVVQRPALLHPELAALRIIDPDLLYTLLAKCARPQDRSALDGIPVESVLLETARLVKCPVARLHRHLMWLLKNDLVAVVHQHRQPDDAVRTPASSRVFMSSTHRISDAYAQASINL